MPVARMSKLHAIPRRKPLFGTYIIVCFRREDCDFSVSVARICAPSFSHLRALDTQWRLSTTVSSKRVTEGGGCKCTRSHVRRLGPVGGIRSVAVPPPSPRHDTRGGGVSARAHARVRCLGPVCAAVHRLKGGLRSPRSSVNTSTEYSLARATQFRW